MLAIVANEQKSHEMAALHSKQYKTALHVKWWLHWLDIHGNLNDVH